MRSYRQWCAIAKALDVIGDRWSLLIVRELLAGPCRYTDLVHGLPGIASNLLSERLRHLEREGVIRREAAPPPVATTLFHLTPRGEALRPVIRELGRWGMPYMSKPARSDAVRSHWLAIPIELYLVDRAPKEPPVSVELRTGDTSLVVETREGKVRTRRGTAEKPDAVITGRAPLLTGLLMGRLDLDAALAEGLQFEGDVAVLERLKPQLALVG